MTQRLSVSIGKLCFTPSQPVWLYQGNEEEMEKKMKKREKEKKEEIEKKRRERRRRSKSVVGFENPVHCTG